MSDSFLSHRRVTRALRRLSELAAAERLALEIALCHGRLVTVVYSLPEDAAGPGRPAGAGNRARELVQQVAAEQRLPARWVEDDVKFFVALTAARDPSQLREYVPSLILSVSEPPHLLAMKLHALAAEGASAAERPELAFLLQRMGLESVAAVAQVYARFFPGQDLPDEARRAVSPLLAAPAHGR